MTGAVIRIKRAGGYPRVAGRVRGIALLCLMAMVTSCVAYAASRAPNALSIVLDAPLPFDPSIDPAVLVRASEDGDGIGIKANDAEPQSGGFSPTLLVSGPAARPFELRGTAQDMLRASLCLTAAIYYEAGNEPDEGQRAVAQVVINRVRHPVYPDTVCGVVYQGTERSDTLCQFTFGCDGSMARMPVSQPWARARRNALAALNGAVYAPVGLATHYHTLAVNPVWNKALTPTAIVGAHIFYRWPGGAGAPKAFHASYRGNEPIPSPRPKAFSPSVPVEMANLPPVQQEWTANASLPAPDARVASVVPSQPLTADRRYIPGALPESDVKEEYRNSGQWIVR